MMRLQLPVMGFLNIILGQFQVLQIRAAPNLSVKPCQIIPVQSQAYFSNAYCIFKK